MITRKAEQGPKTYKTAITIKTRDTDIQGTHSLTRDRDQLLQTVTQCKVANLADLVAFTQAPKTAKAAANHPNQT